MSAIDGYLDELFDRLAGTGAAGRRALAEAEDHLRSAAADGIAAGLPADQAERHAVTRFGPAAVHARQLRSVPGTGPLNRALSAGWLLAGLTASGAAAAWLAAAGRLGWSAPDCTVALTPLCYSADALMGRLATWAAIGAAAGSMLLVARWLAVRRAGLAAARPAAALTASLLAVLAGLVTGAEGWTPIPPFLPHPHLAYLVIGTALLECLAVMATAASPRSRHRDAQSRRPPG